MTRAKTQNRNRLFQEATLLDEVMAKLWLARAVPGDWAFLEDENAQREKKQKVTLYLDGDVLKWFRGLGTGYQSRIADVLRVYARAMQSGELRAAKGVARFAPEDFGGLDGVRGALEAVLRDMGAAGQITKDMLGSAPKVEDGIDFEDARAEVEARLAKMRAIYEDAAR
jgi:uncharacterized protein (DUF4415 family)